MCRRYLNDCLSYCASLGDHCSAAECIPGDVKALVEYGFDSLKVDGCSAQKDGAMWASLINATEKGATMIIENCNGMGSKPSKRVDEGGCPDYHTYRTSGDINNHYGSWISNAQTVAPYATSGRTGPTCWAYPDMLMIGVQGETPDEDWNMGTPGHWEPWDNFVPPTLAEQRTHFGLWCALSSPLTLSLDFTNKSAIDSVWGVITNTHALDVNQQWAGSPGSVFKTSPDTVTIEPQIRSTQSVPRWQAWYKPLPNCSAAIFVANHGITPANITISLWEVPGLYPAVASTGVASPSSCGTLTFPYNRSQQQVIGLQGPVTGGQASATMCRAACCAQGVACDTWSWSPTHLKGGPVCYTGKASGAPYCDHAYEHSAWQGGSRTQGKACPGPAPPPPPPRPPSPPPSPPRPPPAHPIQFTITDVWQQEQLPGAHASYSVPALGAHDSIFITVTPPPGPCPATGQ